MDKASTQDRLAKAENLTRNLLESHFKDKASFPTVSAQSKTDMDGSQFIQISVVFDGDTEIIDDPLWYDHDWHSEVDDLFEENCSVLYRLDKTKYTDQDMKYLRRRLEELSVELSQVSDE